VCYASAVRIPIWLTLGLAGLVILFGSYRIWFGLKKSEQPDAPKRTGLYAMSKKTHLFVGLVYVLLGAGLLATSFGFNPFGGGSNTAETTKKR
jgi:hypothetical protein